MHNASYHDSALDITTEKSASLPLTTGLDRHNLPRSNEDRAIEAHMLTMAGLETEETWRFAASIYPCDPARILLLKTD